MLKSIQNLLTSIVDGVFRRLKVGSDPIFVLISCTACLLFFYSDGNAIASEVGDQLNKRELPFSGSDSFQISESGCMSGCPNYSITVFGDGTFQFQERHPREVPVTQGRLTPTLFAKLSIQIKDGKIRELSAMRKECKELATERSIIRMQLQSSGTSYKVNHNLGCSGFQNESMLVEFEKEIESILNIDMSSLGDENFVNNLQHKN